MGRTIHKSTGSSCQADTIKAEIVVSNKTGCYYTHRTVLCQLFMPDISARMNVSLHMGFLVNEMLDSHTCNFDSATDIHSLVGLRVPEAAMGQNSNGQVALIT